MKGAKICGISDLDTLNYIINHPYPASFIGFIVNYSQSPRFVKFFQRKQVKVVLDLPIAPSSYVLKNIHKLPLYPYDLRKFEDISIKL